MNVNMMQNQYLACGAGFGHASSHIELTSRLVEAPSFPNSNMVLTEITKPKQSFSGFYLTAYLDIIAIKMFSLRAQAHKGYASDLKVNEQTLDQVYTFGNLSANWKTYKPYKVSMSPVIYTLMLQSHFF